MRETLTKKVRERLLALTSIDDPARLTGRGWIIIAALAVLSGIPYLFSPLDTDSALFFVSGRKILNEGAIHYRDIVDIKPPGIYHLYAAEIALLGPSPGSVRIADFCLQLLSGLLMVLVIRRLTRNDLLAGLSALFYLLLYFGQSFRNTGQCESYAALFGFLILWLVLVRKSRTSYVLAGVVAGVLFLFKFTLAILLLLIPIGLFLRKRIPGRISGILGAGAGFAGVVFLFLLYLFLFHAWDDFRLMQEFTGVYARLQWSSLSTAVTTVTDALPSFFGVHYSILFSFLTLLGMTAPLSRSLSEDRSSDGSIPEARNEARRNLSTLLQWTAVAFFLLLFTVILEGKYQGWYFNRLFGFGATLAAYGAVRTFRRLAVMRYTPYAVGLSVLLIPVGGLFSIAPRYLYHSGASVIYRLKGERAFDEYYGYNDDPEAVRLADLKEIGEYLKSNRGPDDEVFIASGAAGLIATYADYIPDFRIYHSGFLIAPYAPEQWREETKEYLLRDRPAFVVLNDDRMEPITASKRSSREAVLALPGIEEMLERNYVLVKQLPALYVYRRLPTDGRESVQP